ncbi:hypothetical protein K431DRAFT_226144 [Polychaeton citri CBS 116435]|uniref:Amino acid transporter transmembrane domain-containing protein n=1 Tax=Polychaeton citri CBS 116435 TaxID=1314669 RepID=A0A9P4UPJ3_9PEZI|nr:hypothetical protein K431DRAFT_226144 [Polychaeton citri CBS 116435]
MPTDRQAAPVSWSDYERGGRHDSLDSQNRVQFDPEAQQPRDGGGSFLVPDGQQNLRRRRSSLSMRISSLAQAGGVNSLNNFASSWQRAANFHAIAPHRASFRYAEDGEDDGSRPHTPQGPAGLLRQQLEARRATASGSAGPASLRPSETQPLLQERLSRVRDDHSIFSIEPSLASPFGGSYGTRYSSTVSRANEPKMRHAAQIFKDQQAKKEAAEDDEPEPILVKQVREGDGTIVNVVVGRSTLPQSILNMVNLMIGIGLLALPLAFKYSGWIPGAILLSFAAFSTNYTAKLLAKCLDVDSSLLNFADVAYVSFGAKARVMVSLLFSMELLAICVALVVLFADSLDALIPGWGLTEWKLVCGLVLLPLEFLPLRLLSFTSILGIISCFSIVLAVFVDGLIKPDQPGSLRDPAMTSLWPQSWMTLPLSFGLLMSPWGGHSVFPNIYRDMRHPYKFRRGVDITYILSFIPDAFMAVIGLIMFGNDVKDEVTRNIFVTKGYPQWISVFIVICIAIIPLTKLPLNSQPIVGTAEIFLRLDPISVANAEQDGTGFSPFVRHAIKALVKIVLVIILVIFAIVVPDFDRIMSLVGAVACSTVCIILPIAFHLKLFGHEMSRSQKVFDYTLMVFSGMLGVVSTAFNFIPKEQLGL